MSFEEISRLILNELGLHTDPNIALLLFGLTLARILAALLMVPFIGGPSVPGQVKVGLSVALTVLLLPGLIPADGAAPPGLGVMVTLLVKETAIGIMIGFIAQLVFYAIQLAGILVDTQRGMNQITYLAPQLPGHVSTLGNLQFQAALALFLTLNGHLLFLKALARSFQQLPPLSLPHIRPGIPAMMDMTIHITSGTILTGCQLAAPVVLALFLVDAAFGFLGKAASQIKVSGESNTVKSLLGILLTFLLFALLLRQMQVHFAAMLRNISDFVAALA